MSKYKAIKTEIDGYVFASRKEANHYLELSLREKAGEISDLELQPQFPCTVNGKLVCKYIADFRYYDAKTEQVVTVDVKGFKTPVYRMKKKLVEAIYNIVITEV